VQRRHLQSGTQAPAAGGGPRAAHRLEQGLLRVYLRLGVLPQGLHLEHPQKAQRVKIFYQGGHLALRRRSARVLVPHGALRVLPASQEDGGPVLTIAGEGVAGLVVLPKSGE
jgi:hypothetical protein